VHHTIWYAAKIKSAASGGVLDIPGGAQNVGTMIQQFHDGGRLCFNQYWYFMDVDGYRIQTLSQDQAGSMYSLCNDLVMVPAAPPGLPPGQPSKVTLVRIQDARDGWVIHMDAANVAIRSANSLRTIPLALDLTNGDPHDNVSIQVFGDNGGINQRWNIA